MKNNHRSSKRIIVKISVGFCLLALQYFLDGLLQPSDPHISYAVAPTVLAALAAIPALYKIGSGISDNAKAKKLETRYPRPKYEIPQAETDALNYAKMSALDVLLPGQKRLEERISANTANNIFALTQTATSPAGLQAGVAASIGNEQEMFGDLSVKAAENYQRKQENLVNQLERYGDFQDKKWQTNIMDPYKNAMLMASKLREAGKKNTESGVSDMAGIAGMYVTGGYGKGKGTGIETTDTLGTKAPNYQENMFPDGGGFTQQKEMATGSGHTDPSGTEALVDKDFEVIANLNASPEYKRNWLLGKGYSLDKIMQRGF